MGTARSLLLLCKLECPCTPTFDSLTQSLVSDVVELKLGPSQSTEAIHHLREHRWFEPSILFAGELEQPLQAESIF